MVKKRGQAAMEFLMTYGWAILVVLVVVSALAYFGVLSPDNLLPEKCSFPIQLSCSDFLVGNKGISLILQNGGGRDMRIESVTFGGEALSGDCSLVNLDAEVYNGETVTLFADDPAGCHFVNKGRGKNRYNINLSYTWLGSNLPAFLKICPQACQITLQEIFDRL